MKHLDADALNEEFDLLVLEHRKANVTAVVVRLEECFDIFARVAARLAKTLGRRTWSYWELSGTEIGMGVTAFDTQGGKRWAAESQSEQPYWRMAADFKGRPKKPLFGLGLSPVLRLDEEPGWKSKSRRLMAFSEAKRAALTLEAKRRADDAAARDLANRHYEAKRAREEEQLAQARRQEAEAESRRLINRTPALGEPKQVLLPQSLHVEAQKLVKRYGVELSWVWQAAIERATPWKFPKTALGAVPLTNPQPATLVVSPALAQALAKSSIMRADETVGSFEELVRVAVSVGLDQLKEDLKEDQQKLSRLARKSGSQPRK